MNNNINKWFIKIENMQGYHVEEKMPLTTILNDFTVIDCFSYQQDNNFFLKINTPSKIKSFIEKSLIESNKFNIFFSNILLNYNINFNYYNFFKKEYKDPLINSFKDLKKEEKLYFILYKKIYKESIFNSC